MSFHSDADRGQGNSRTQMTGNNIATASRKRAAANVIGGKSTRPILMNIHVVPHIKQRTSHTRIVMFVLSYALSRPEPRDRNHSRLASLVKTQTGFSLF